MRAHRLLIAASFLAAAAGCMQSDPAQAAYPQQPGQPPGMQSGPPGGGMDPQYGPQYPSPSYPQAAQGPGQGPGQGPDSADPYTGGDVNADAQAPQNDPSQGPQAPYGADPAQAGDPNDPNAQQMQGDPNAMQGGDPNAMQGDPNDPNGTGDVSDQDIQQTLAPYGQWEDDDGTQVWVPDATEVGADFTPYDTDGSWLWSDAGWSFSAGWGWGWLPFHYGRWGWFHNHWGWEAGHRWGPGWVDWRSGGGLVGWRPMSPVGAHGFEMHDSHWNFVHNGDLGAGRIHGHLTGNIAEGLRSTTNVVRPGVRGNYSPVATSSVMRGRFAATSRAGANGGFRGNAIRSQSFNNGRTNQPIRGNTPTWRAPQQSFRAPQQGVRQYGPSRSYSGSSGPRSYAPARSFSAPSRSFSAPSRSYSAPHAATHSAPSHSFSGGGHSFGGGHSSGGGGGGGGGSHSSGGGGGHHR